MNPNLEIVVEVRLPRSGKSLRAATQMHEHIFSESFAPLPRDRELPWAISEREQAARQKAMRREIARTLGNQLAEKLIELIENEDPQYGYLPEEWRRINSANDKLNSINLTKL